MKTKVFKNSDKFDQMVDIILSDGLVAFPTETVYGLGANGLNPKAVNKIFAAKGRPNDNPLILHVHDKASFLKLTPTRTSLLHKILDEILPAPLTLIVQKSEEVPNEVTAGLKTVAIRIPQNKTALNFLKACGVPIAAPSANTSGKPSPTKAEHVLNDLDGKIDAIIDGGDCNVGVESTILDISSDIPTILRLGGMPLESIKEFCPNVIVANSAIKGDVNDDTSKTPKAPGMKYRHYAPQAPLYIINRNFENIVIENIGKYSKIGVLYDNSVNINFLENHFNNHNNDVFLYNLGITPEEISHNLFNALREMDKQNVDVIFVPYINGEGILSTIYNRLYKASNKPKIVKDATEYNLELSGEIIGNLEYRAVEDSIDIIDINIFKNYRGMGFGKLLLNDFLSDFQAYKVFLEVRESNIIAINLYKKFDFKQISTRKNYYSNPTEDAIIMKRSEKL
ncbi:MAG: threonylcarbamoyl-AMP synthase [Clostridiales bacterium]|jgi:L-threonylcarbamoyladenylate synthase|nr:threonylcarbamoyl-AMP synthase [Clostridiales bacterium]